ncbi:TIGR04282 family arsenosugar biosynthesis glycosyltransferase [Emticicia sp. SJ17W-69]|uniref:TIGR04282 family arsenosugar biosynthesis glycosyltransferase n=1 Tax=Emticicia sp. SJ17W-69 TaxID=3421657 RepID=UPI003EBB6E16
MHTQLQKIQNALIIFIKNPQLGKVKTRLAATVGNEKALEIYQVLMSHTHRITNDLNIEKYLYYSDFIDHNDIWSNDNYHKYVQQQGQDLGLKMASAFRDTLQNNCSKVIIIGSDCLELTDEIINDGYEQLIDNEVVIGPATDGGYYLIGFNFETVGERCGEVLKRVFLEKQWSHVNVCDEAIKACNDLKLKISKLPILTDVDEEKDFLQSIHLVEDLPLKNFMK